MQLDKLSNFDTKTVGIFKPNNAWKENGVLFMTSYKGKGTKIECAVGKYNKRNNRPLLYAMTVSKFDPITMKTYVFNFGLTSFQQGFKELEVAVDITELPLKNKPFCQELVKLIVYTIGLYSKMFYKHSGAIQINFAGVFYAVVDSKEYDNVFADIKEDIYAYTAS